MNYFNYINIENWLTNSTTIKLLEVAIGVLIIAIAFSLIRSFLARNIQDSDTRYRTRKAL